MNPTATSKNSSCLVLVGSFLVLSLAINEALATITVSIGNGLRISSGLTSTNRYRDAFKCYWDCDLVGCQLSRFDDECAYDCEKVCRSRYDYVGRSDAEAKPLGASETELKPKSSAPVDANAESDPSKQNMPEDAGQTVRLYMPRNVTVTKFGIWERCAGQEGSL